MNYSDFIYDFNLYLCERFGYRNCCSVMHNANGICVSVHVGEMDSFLGIQLRRWQHPRLEHYHCAQQLQTEPTGKPEGPCPLLQGVRSTLWLQIPLHRG